MSHKMFMFEGLRIKEGVDKYINIGTLSCRILPGPDLDYLPPSTI